MDFNFLSKLQGKTEKKEFFLALLLKPEQIGAILFEEKDGQLLILASEQENIQKEIEHTTAEELILASDHVISAVEQQLPDGAEVKKTIFSLPADFVESGKIKKEYLSKFKKLCDELDLTPVGFIVTIEALVYFLQKKEGIPITAIFIEIGKHRVVVYLVKNNTIVETHASSSDSTISHTVGTILKRVETFEALPAKIILLSYEGSEKIQQELLSFPWTKELPFLHHPNVRALEKGFEDEAVINGVATQMGFDVLAAATPSASSEIDMPVKESEPQVNAESFGFVEDVDIAEKEEHKDTEEVSSHEAFSEEFKNHKDDSQKQEPRIREFDQEEIEKQNDSNEDLKDEPEEIAEINHPQHSIARRKQGRGMSRFISDITLYIGRAASRISLPRVNGFANFTSLRLLLIGLFCIGILGVGVYVYYTYIVKAEVVVFLNKKSFDKTSDIIFSPDSTDPSKQQIKMSEVTLSEDGTGDKETTGKKETGEKAKGEVTIYNKTEQSKSFQKGTSITGPNNLEFILASDVTVASTAAFATSNSTVKVSIEASKIGPEYNLPSATNFSFKDYPTSSYFAKNDSAFSGGTKKTLDVVAKKDLDTLASETLDKLRDKAKSDLASKAQGDTVALPLLLSEDFSTKTFSKKEGDEAKQVSLKATISFTGATYNKNDLENYVKQLSQNTIPQDYTFLASDSKIEVKDIKAQKDKTLSATLSARSVFLPQIEIEAIKQSIVRRKLSDAQSLVEKAKNVSDPKIILENTIPFLPAYVPFNKKNIRLTTKINE